MDKIAFRVIGRLSNIIDVLYKSIAGRVTPDDAAMREGPDATGRVVSDQSRLNVIWRDDEVIFAMYDRLAHSFWRSQELSLFFQHLSLLRPPVADFGCGDGSFASVLLKEVDYGIDVDSDALIMADRFGIYRSLICSDDRAIPLEDSSVNSIFSNSVLEHTINLDSVLQELYRILNPSGLLCFTVPVTRFAEDLTKFFGAAASERANRTAYHRNLLPPDEWAKRLDDTGFEVIDIIEYQPDWFTFYYWMMRFIDKAGNPIREFLWNKIRMDAIAKVRESIKGKKGGGNIFVIAKKSS